MAIYFLKAPAQLAGLMVVPVLLGSNMVEAQGRMAGHNHMASVAGPLAGMVATGGRRADGTRSTYRESWLLRLWWPSSARLVDLAGEVRAA